MSALWYQGAELAATQHQAWALGKGDIFFVVGGFPQDS